MYSKVLETRQAHVVKIDLTSRDNPPVTKWVWLNLYKDGYGYLYPSEGAAVKAAYEEAVVKAKPIQITY